MAGVWNNGVVIEAAGAILPYNAAVAAMGHEKITKMRKIFSITTTAFGDRKITMSCSKVGGSGPMLIFPRFAARMLLDAKIVRGIESRLRGGAALGAGGAGALGAGGGALGAGGGALGAGGGALGAGGGALKLTANQEIVLAHLMSKVYTPANVAVGAAGAIVHMGAGYGKTYLACGVIAALGRRTAVVVPNRYLQRQWCGVLAAVFPAAKVVAHCGAGGVAGDIVVSVVNSAMLYNYADIGLVIYDEVHMYCTRRMSAVFGVAQARFGLGLTATPNERLDGFDPVARWWVGPLIDAAALPGWDPGAVRFRAAITRVMYNGPDEYTEMLVSAAGTVSVPLMLNQLITDPWRNVIIVEHALRLYDRGHNVFIFSDRREHLTALAAALTAARPGAAIEAAAGVLMGGAKEADIVRVTAGRIILTTYQYSGTGISIEKMDALILATPRRSKLTQILGRIFRLGGDQAIRREVIDIVDNRTTLKSQYHARKKIYAAAGYAQEICTVKYDWDDITARG